MIPKYQDLVDAEDERNKRVKRYAEVSLSLSKLPPRMEDHKLQEKDKRDKVLKKAADSFKATHTFNPSRAREVPDFKRLHKEFTAQMNRNKSAKKQTDPKPFAFHEPKQRVDLRVHMDLENQQICPTLKKRASSAKMLNLDLYNENQVNPSTTKKHEALVKHNRYPKINKLN